MWTHDIAGEEEKCRDKVNYKNTRNNKLCKRTKTKIVRTCKTERSNKEMEWQLERKMPRGRPKECWMDAKGQELVRLEISSRWRIGTGSWKSDSVDGGGENSYKDMKMIQIWRQWLKSS